MTSVDTAEQLLKVVVLEPRWMLFPGFYVYSVQNEMKKKKNTKICVKTLFSHT